ncbi:hypothetical protein HDU98_006965 [Podochytrium sp. JEL0797]|nr:hypothetical protein HDU98_006965 [Podochytrium sp. JEL0797]
MVVVADSGYSFRVKMTNMHELDGEVAKMLLHLKPLNKSEHAAFENKLPVCVCDYKDCGKTFTTMEGKGYSDYVVPALNDAPNDAANAPENVEEDVEENEDVEELGEEGGDDVDEMDVDVEHEIGGDDAGEANMLEGEGDPPIPELGPDPVPNPPEYSSLEVTLSTPGSALFFGSLSMMASSQAIDSSEVATAVAKISTSRNHRWPLHLDQKSDNRKLNNPAATGPEKKKESSLLPDYKPFATDASDYDALSDQEHFSSFTSNLLFSQKHGIVHRLTGNKCSANQGLFTAIHRQVMKSKFENFKKRALKKQAKETMIQLVRSFFYNAYHNGLARRGYKPQQFQLIPNNNVAVQFRGHEEKGLQQLDSISARQVCYSIEPTEANTPQLPASEKPPKSRSLMLPTRVTMQLGGVNGTTVTLDVAARQRPKLLPTDDTHHLGLKTSDSQDYIFKPMQIQYLEKTQVLLLHIPLALAETPTPENAKPIPVSPPVKKQHTCTDGNCLDCFTPRSFRPKAVPPAPPSNTTHTDWQLLIWEEGKSPECLKSFHAAGEIEVRWNLNPKTLAPGTPCVIAADPGLKTPFVFVDNYGNIYRLGYRHTQLIKYCYDCIAALESECDQRVNAMDSVVTRQADLDAAINSMYEKMKSALSMDGVDAAVAQLRLALQNAKVAARKEVNEEYKIHQVDNKDEFASLRRDKFQQHFRPRKGKENERVDMGPFKPQTFDEEIAMYRARIADFTTLIQNVSVQFCTRFNMVYMPKFNTTTNMAVLGFAKIRERLKREMARRGGVYVEVDENFTTCLCPLCGCNSPPGLSRYFICANGKCGFRCDRDTKSAMLILLLSLTASVMETNYLRLLVDALPGKDSN